MPTLKCPGCSRLVLGVLLIGVATQGCSGRGDGATGEDSAGGGAGGEAPSGAGGETGAGGSAAGGGAGEPGGDGGSPGSSTGGGGEQGPASGAGGAAGVGAQPMGGAGGSPATGTGGAGTPLNAACKEMAACDDFEKMAAGAYPAAAIFKAAGTSLQALSVVSDRAKSGKKSIKMTAPKNAGPILMTLGRIPEITGGGAAVYARMMLYFAPTVVQTTREGQAPHWKLIRFVESRPGKTPASVSAGVTGADTGRILYYRADADCAADGGKIPANVWTCVEFRADTNGYEMWIDGKTAGRATATGAGCWERHGAVQSIAFGLEMSAATRVKDETFWIDDLAVSSKRINCP